MDMVVVADVVDMREGGEVMVLAVAAAEGAGVRVVKVTAKDQRTGTTNSYSSNGLIPLSVLCFLVNPNPKPKPDPPPLLPLPPTLPLLAAAAAVETIKAVGKDRFHESMMIRPSSSSSGPNKSQHKTLKPNTYEHEQSSGKIKGTIFFFGCVTSG